MSVEGGREEPSYLLYNAKHKRMYALDTMVMISSDKDVHDDNTYSP